MTYRKRVQYTETNNLRSNDAMVQDFYQYFSTIYKHIENFGNFAYQNNADGMFRSVSNLYDVVACRFSLQDADTLLKELDYLQQEVFSLPKKAITMQMQAVINNKRQQSITKLRIIHRKIMVILNAQNMLVPTFVQDFRPKVVQG